MTDDEYFDPRLSGFRPPQPPPDEPDRPRRGETWAAFCERWQGWRREMERYNAQMLRRSNHPQDAIRVDDPNRGALLEKVLARLKRN
ncbi:hypothetical protein IGS68_33510 (plasmid) [Skermanella sp. TT6]|uniref:Uncharacterized protein n=1 Tax=Skermanella cutis TaxID=2775420 RepID=A0ABX7BGM4_9PROT|nr:hypothetical protein [Skermanella sp. TT6]QQP93540.1 hypothetical protein IGS68_33510 [Skermanella sp. TT6]